MGGPALVSGRADLPVRRRGRAGPLPVQGRDGPLAARGGRDRFGGRDVARRSRAFGPFGILPSRGHGRTRSAWRFGGSAEGQSGTEALRGASARGGGRPYATRLGPSSRRCGFITTWRRETECMLLSRYGDTDPPSLMRLPSAPEWRMMLRAAHGGRRPLPSLVVFELDRQADNGRQIEHPPVIERVLRRTACANALRVSDGGREGIREGGQDKQTD
jgi:hypothetical protein